MQPPTTRDRRPIRVNLFIASSLHFIGSVCFVAIKWLLDAKILKLYQVGMGLINLNVLSGFLNFVIKSESVDGH